jgi:hypothetical protein
MEATTTRGLRAPITERLQARRPRGARECLSGGGRPEARRDTEDRLGDATGRRGVTV